MSETRQEPEVDELAKLVHGDMLQDAKRLKGMTDASIETLQQELASTIMYHLRKLGDYVIQIRNWSFQSVQDLGDHVAEIELLAAGAADQETQLTEEDAEKFVKLVTAARTLCDQLLEHHQTDEAKKKLDEIKELADDCESIVRDNVLTSEDEDEEDEDEMPPEASEGIH